MAFKTKNQKNKIKNQKEGRYMAVSARYSGLIPAGPPKFLSEVFPLVRFNIKSILL